MFNKLFLNSKLLNFDDSSIFLIIVLRIFEMIIKILEVIIIIFEYINKL